MAFKRSRVRAPYPPLRQEALRDNELRKAFLLHPKAAA
jgi:hypothetical protein